MTVLHQTSTTPPSLELPLGALQIFGCQNYNILTAKITIF